MMPRPSTVDLPSQAKPFRPALVGVSSIPQVALSPGQAMDVTLSAEILHNVRSQGHPDDDFKFALCSVVRTSRPVSAWTDNVSALLMGRITAQPCAQTSFPVLRDESCSVRITYGGPSSALAPSSNFSARKKSFMELQVSDVPSQAVTLPRRDVGGSSIIDEYCMSSCTWHV